MTHINLYWSHAVFGVQYVRCTLGRIAYRRNASLICVIELIFSNSNDGLMKSVRLDFTILIIRDALIKTQFISKLKLEKVCSRPMSG